MDDEIDRRVMVAIDTTDDDDNANWLQAGRDELPADGHAPAVAFHCLICGAPCGHPEQVVLNTRVGSLLGFDMAEPGASTYTCTACAHVHWFASGNPAAWQGLGRDARGEPGDGCAVCGYAQYVAVERQLNTRGLTFLNLDFLNKTLRGASCVRCGFIHWHAGANPWKGRLPAGTPRDRFMCLCCGGTDVATKQALINQRVSTAFGLDWLDRGATVAVCVACDATYWFGRGAPLMREHTPDRA